MFYLKNYHLHRQKTFTTNDNIRSLRGPNVGVRWDVAETGDAGTCARLEGLPDLAAIRCEGTL